MYRPMADDFYITIMMPILAAFIIIGVIGCILFAAVTIYYDRKNKKKKD